MGRYSKFSHFQYKRSNAPYVTRHTTLMETSLFLVVHIQIGGKSGGINALIVFSTYETDEEFNID